MFFVDGADGVDNEEGEMDDEDDGIENAMAAGFNVDADATAAAAAFVSTVVDVVIEDKELLP
jgi:hypothetical protein